MAGAELGFLGEIVGDVLHSFRGEAEAVLVEEAVETEEETKVKGCMGLGLVALDGLIGGRPVLGWAAVGLFDAS